MEASHESDRIIKAVQDYIEGWTTQDIDRVRSALHPELVKRAYLPKPEVGAEVANTTCGDLLETTLLEKAHPGQAEIKVLDQFEGIASVRAVMEGWVDYIHLMKTRGEWKIINILWELSSSQWRTRGGPNRGTA